MRVMAGRVFTIVMFAHHSISKLFQSEAADVLYRVQASPFQRKIPPQPRCDQVEYLRFTSAILLFVCFCNQT